MGRGDRKTTTYPHDQYGPYKPILVCFECRKAFKRPRVLIGLPKDFLNSQELKCPQCNAPMYHAGRKFKAPRQSNRNGWQVAEALIKQGYTYDFDDFISAPPPTRMRDVAAFLEDFKKRFMK